MGSYSAARPQYLFLPEYPPGPVIIHTFLMVDHNLHVCLDNIYVTSNVLLLFHFPPLSYIQSYEYFNIFLAPISNLYVLVSMCHLISLNVQYTFLRGMKNVNKRRKCLIST